MGAASFGFNHMAVTATFASHLSALKNMCLLSTDFKNGDRAEQGGILQRCHPQDRHRVQEGADPTNMHRCACTHTRTPHTFMMPPISARVKTHGLENLYASSRSIIPGRKGATRFPNPQPIPPGAHTRSPSAQWRRRRRSISPAARSTSTRRGPAPWSCSPPRSSSPAPASSAASSSASSFRSAPPPCPSVTPLARAYLPIHPSRGRIPLGAGPPGCPRPEAAGKPGISN